MNGTNDEINARLFNLKVTIITIVYNGASTLELTIKSVINQTYKNIEYIIIDGNSSDGTVDIIKKYQDKITYWVSESDKGISDAFNKGIKLASGALVGLLNSGDFYENNSIELIIDRYFAEKNRGILSNYFVIHGNVKMINGFKSKIYSPPPIETFIYQMPIWHPTAFVSKEVYEELLYDLEYKVAMDYDLFSRMYNQKVPFYYVDALIASMDVNGISNKAAIRGFNEVMRASRKNLGVGTIRSLFYLYARCIIYKITDLKKNYQNILNKLELFPKRKMNA